MDRLDARQITQWLTNVTDLVLIARGGQKAVYRARHAEYDDIVVKVTADDERALREIYAVQQSSLPNVPQIYAHHSVRYEGQHLLIVLEEYIDGVSLQDRLEMNPTLSLCDVVKLLQSLLRIVVETDRQRLVHRDIKPANIMLAADGSVWLLDFGIARHLDKESLTKTAQRFGPATIGYAAPEQLRNRKQDVDARTDLFAIGTVAYQCLSGTQPFVDGARDLVDVLRRTESVYPPPLQIVGDRDGKLADFIGSLMSKSPAFRPRSGAEALSWFEELLPSLDAV